ncbi:zinc ribbon domain-containing protein [Aureispira anguillae]|uniref:C4-type zinc ribbon domain-containing protein n=1 Tax=Aureispira anguillae TaxID=2864201 RepID=A0A916DUZ5_9BACT|nr:C4-type zinc ribbon domain-containing protein [Aureispira anguillae]BDS13836.1 C4-type zinc ribbon domain-containing protein [Aureispira anguillae]
MAKKNANANLPVEEKLKNLYELQMVNTKLNNIKKLQGELPLEVSALENEIGALDKRIVKLEEEHKELQMAVVQHENKIKEAEALIEKYNKQQNNVKNNREYEALTREVELQKLDIQLANKRIRETQQKLSNKDITLEASKKKQEDKRTDMKLKQEELEKITAKTEKDEQKFLRKEKRARKKIDESLLAVYDKLATSYKNGLAVVTVERDACSGCFSQVPPQTQLELGQRKRIITCEHCARVLVASNIEMSLEELEAEQENVEQ